MDYRVGAQASAPPCASRRRRRYLAVTLTALMTLHMGRASSRYTAASAVQRSPLAAFAFSGFGGSGGNGRRAGGGSSGRTGGGSSGRGGGESSGRGRDRAPARGPGGGRTGGGKGGGGNQDRRGAETPAWLKGALRPDKPSSGGGRANSGGRRGRPSGPPGEYFDLPRGDGMERLNKVLAHAGVASRRGVETLILQGRVSVNGVKVTDVGAKVSTTGQDSVSVDNKPVDVKAPSGAGVQWLALNKPKGIVTSLGDDKGRKHLGDVVPQATEKRLLPVGKLDRECSGLVLLTNDHESSHLLSQPSFGLIKEYKVVVQNGLPKLAVLEALAEGGVKLKEPSPASGSGKPSAASGSGRPSPTFGSGKAASYGGTGRANRPVRSTQPMEVEVLDFFADRKETVLRVVVRDASSQMIRRALEQAEHPVKSIKRIVFGGIKLGTMGLGESRKLSPSEVIKIKQAVAAYRRKLDKKKRKKDGKETTKVAGGKAKPAAGAKAKEEEGEEVDEDIEAFWDAVEEEEDEYEYDEDDYPLEED